MTDHSILPSPPANAAIEFLWVGGRGFTNETRDSPPWFA